uniref:Peptidase A2 domain-containing protein n=1 Tax=Rhodnius prolixus TaxID=13249 RepID=T1HDT0_RHOPR
MTTTTDSTCTLDHSVCGRAGHFRNDPSCPARDKICNKCKMKGHFAGMCHTQLKKRKPHISQVQTKEAPSSDSGSSVFRLSAKGNDEPFIKCSVGGVPLQMLIDSGAGTSVIDKE